MYLEGAFGEVERPGGAEPPAVGDLEVAHQEAVLCIGVLGCVIRSAKDTERVVGGGDGVRSQ